MPHPRLFASACLLHVPAPCVSVGSVSKSGCSVLYDVDDRTCTTQSRGEIFANTGAALAGFFLQPNVHCVFFTQDFAAERDGVDAGFILATVDAAEISRSSTTGGGEPSKALVDSVVAAHATEQLSLAFYAHGVLRTVLLRRPLLSAEPCTLSGLSFAATVALEGSRVFVFFDAAASSTSPTSSTSSSGSSGNSGRSGDSFLCVVDAHLVNVWLALLFADQVEAADADAVAAAASGGSVSGDDSGSAGEGSPAAAKLRKELETEPW